MFAMVSASGLAMRDTTQSSLLQQLAQVRAQSLALCQPLSPEDMMVQSFSEASPAKWHLAHTSWFFETFLLREFLPDYLPFHPDFEWLFNSYYNAVSSQPAKQLRASFSRPALSQILDYRAYVDDGLRRLFSGDAPEEAVRRLVLGLHHEQQHGELLLTDVKHALWSNPLRPSYRSGRLPQVKTAARTSSCLSFDEGLATVGCSGDVFCFDNEQPAHRVWMDAFRLATLPVCCSDYLAFMRDGGYARSDLWLSEGWEIVQRERWNAPLYWHQSQRKNQDLRADDWTIFTLRGDVPFDLLHDAPVCHVSYYEAQAFAQWAGMRLPFESEWELAATNVKPQIANMLEGDSLHPLPAVTESTQQHNLQAMFGGVWEWTSSAYLGYPGYTPVAGALGEYNGKFMSNKMVLRGGSIATPLSHIRATYRNFFPPETRWQFSGIRLATR
jgi:ergothioneine biosynthesis protein EgtB